MSLFFGICFILYFLKLSAGRGFLNALIYLIYYVAVAVSGPNREILQFDWFISS